MLDRQSASLRSMLSRDLNVPSSPPYSPAILTTGCAVLLIAAAYTATVEVGPFATDRLSERSTVSAMANGLLAPALSLQSQTDFLYHCRVAMTSLTGRAQPSSVRADILETCADGSQAIVEDEPGFSAAWHTGALAASFAGDAQTMNDWLSQSYRTGPAEQWIAELRVDLFEDNIAKLDSGLTDLHLADLRMLLSNDRGRRFLASRYLLFPALRQRIDEVLLRTSEPDARRFGNIVERLAVEKARSNGR